MINVDTDMIKSIASKIDSSVDRYMACYNELVMLLNETSGWTGKDASAYASATSEDSKKLKTQANGIKDAAECLRKASEAYEYYADELYKQAQTI